MLTIDGSSQQSPFFEVFYRLDGLKSGKHHPDGILWIRTTQPEHCIHDRKVPLAAVAPTILSLLGIQPPPTMKCASLDLPALTPRGVTLSPIPLSSKGP